MAAVGADGINFDTTAPAGDAEFVLGFHGELEYKGTRLAGLWPHRQVKVVEQAGAHLFGPVVNTSSRKSTPWNVARAVTIVEECSRVAELLDIDVPCLKRL
jgi:dimethylamine---corrinoid protein Co-methyltransferase